MESYNNYQNNPYGDGNSEAVKIVNALKPVIKAWNDEWNRNCVRAKKMTVKTAPNGSTIGVIDAFSPNVMNIPYSTGIETAVVGDTVWCVWMCDNMQTLVAMWTGTLKNNKLQQLTMTRTNNSIVDATSFSRMTAWKKNGYLYLKGNMSTAATAATSDLVEIGRITGWNAKESAYLNLPSQNDGAKPMLLQVSDYGVISVYGANGLAGSWYRFTLCVPQKE